MALFRKLFYHKPPEGLLEISDRVYVFDCCFSTEAREEDKNYKEYIGSIVSQLKDHFPDASFLVFNFHPLEAQSLMSKIVAEYDMTLMDYPCHYQGCPLLQIELINHFLRSTESWFAVDPQNVLLMHCERGGWPVLAFMLATLLIYRSNSTGEQRTLDMVYKQAPCNLLPVDSVLNPVPSQIRYLQYVARRNVVSEWPPLDRALNLGCVIMRLIPDFDGGGGCRPSFRLYGQDPVDASDRNSKLLFSTVKSSKAVRSYKQAESEVIKIDINCNIQGDVVLECFHLKDDMESEEMMFRVMFNTAFIRSNILMLNRDEVDTLWHTKDHFPKDFRAEILFSDMDGVAPVVAAISSCFEEKEGLPVEAFAKVQEFFSNVDWLDSRADAALNLLQKISESHASEKSGEGSADGKHTTPPSKLAEKVQLLASGASSKREEKAEQHKAEALEQLDKSLHTTQDVIESKDSKFQSSSTNKTKEFADTIAKDIVQSSTPPQPPSPPPKSISSASGKSTPQPPQQSPLPKSADSVSEKSIPQPAPPSTPPKSTNSVSDKSTPQLAPPSAPPKSKNSLSGKSTPQPLPLPPNSTISVSAKSAPPPPPPPKSENPAGTMSTPPPPPSAPSAPPPPPPSLNIGVPQAGSGPIPAPPPSLKSRGPQRSLGQKNSQAKKMKPLHWMKLNRAVKGSLWAEAQKSEETPVAPEIDMSELESLFSASAPPSSTKASGGKPSREIAQPKPEKVQLIDTRRACNCEIMLSKVKVPINELMSVVLTLEESAMDADQVDNLIKFCPTKEEMDLLKNYKGEREKLGKCEQFFLTLMQVPRVEAKLRIYSFKLQFRTQVSDLKRNLDVASSVSDQIRGSAKLKSIMQTILSLGNALNQGTARGSAVGFRLDSLLKLNETRARNNKMTLMNYLCKVINEKLPEVLDFSKDLTSVEPASKVQIKFLAEEMQSISKGLEKVVQEFSSSENDGSTSDVFRKSLKEFIKFAEGEVKSLASLYSEVGRKVDELITYFGEDPARCSFEQVISTLLNFMTMFNQAHEQNCKQLELESKKAEKDLGKQK